MLRSGTLEQVVRHHPLLAVGVAEQRGCGLAQAMELAERLRAAVARADVAETGPITASMGVAQLAAGETGAALLQRADDAMYRAKSSGRNSVVAAEPV